MIYREFENSPELTSDVATLLTEYFTSACGLILPGGTTPFSVYEELRQNPPKAGDDLHIMLSDERYVPIVHESSNYGRMVPMFDAIGTDTSRLLHVDTDLPFDEAVDGYGESVSRFISDGGTISLALLGLGVDGHTASLFSDQHIESGCGKCAVGVVGPDQLQRISLTAEVIRRAERIIFVVSGQKKKDIVGDILINPFAITAGKVIDGASEVEMWYSLYD